MSSTPPATPRPPHSRSASSSRLPALAEPPRSPDPVPSSSSSSPRSTKTASRLMTSMRRSFSSSSTFKKRQADMASAGMYSTPAERNSASRSRFRQYDSASTRPTVEQIAMGLHISRTPHLRPLGTQHSYSQRNSAPTHRPHSTNPYETIRHPALPLPPPPARSSLKKSSTPVSTSSSSPPTNPGLSAASASSTTVTSNTPSTPNSNRSLASLKLRMARLLPNARPSSAPCSLHSSPVSSPRDSAEFQVHRKAVRFSTQSEVD